MHHVVDDAYDESLPKRSIFTYSGKDPHGVSVTFPGYGDRISGSAGIPVYIEYRNGIPHVIIWADINQEDPTHTISLEGAAMAKRHKPEAQKVPDAPQTEQPAADPPFTWQDIQPLDVLQVWLTDTFGGDLQITGTVIDIKVVTDYEELDELDESDEPLFNHEETQICFKSAEGSSVCVTEKECKHFRLISRRQLDIIVGCTYRFELRNGSVVESKVTNKNAQMVEVELEASTRVWLFLGTILTAKKIN